MVEKLKKARLILVEEGWRQGSYGATGKPHCASGALEEVGCFIGSPEYRAVCKAAGVDGLMLSFWNDQPGRTKEEVLAVFDKAINRTTRHEHSS